MKNLTFTILISSLLQTISVFGQEVTSTFDWTDNGGTISAQYPGYTDQSVNYLFDDNEETTYLLEGNTQAWFQYESPVPLVITSYTVVSGPGNSPDDPKDWEIQSSDDGINWTTLKSETGQAFDYRLMQKNYLAYTSFSAVGKRFFRLAVKANNGGSNLQIAEWQLFGYPETLESDLTDNAGISITAQYTGYTGEGIDRVYDNELRLSSGNSSKYTVTGQKSVWIKFQSPTAYVIDKYSLSSPCCTWDRNPRSWQLLGSNDGTTWKVIDARYNKTFIANSSVASPFNMQMYTISQPEGQPMDWASCADTAQAVLMEQYWNGTYFNQENTTPPHTGFNYWWHAHALDVLVDAYNRTNDTKYRDRMDALISGVFTKNGGTLQNTFYDDMEWMGLACLRAYYATNDEKWKNYATQLWDWIKTGWTETLPAGGGIMWATGSPDSKNACSNGPAAILAARLYKLTKEQGYLDWSKKIYKWLRDTLSDASRGLVWDGYTSRDNEGMLFTYNQGTYLGAGLELYLITNDDYYLDEAKRTASYVVNDREKFCSRAILQGEGTGDGGLFKGIFMRYLSQLIIYGNLNEETRLSFLFFFRENGKSLWKSATLKPNVIFGSDWINRPSGPSISCSNHLSGIMLFELLDELQRLNFVPDKYYGKMHTNAQKAYKYILLDIIGNTAYSDMQLSEWQLFGRGPDTPVVAITSPSDGTEFPFSDNITFSASVSSFPGVMQVAYYEWKDINGKPIPYGVYSYKILLNGEITTGTIIGNK